MKFKNLHEDKITIITPAGKQVANQGEFVELDEKTYNMVKGIYPKLQPVADEPKVEPVAKAQPKTKASKKCK